MISQNIPLELEIAGSERLRLRRWLMFVLVAVLLYLCAYVIAESIVRSHSEKSRLFMIESAPQRQYDYVILGASHAMPLGFEDENEILERAVGGSVINLSVEGGGIVPARFMLDYFLARHESKTVVYVLDSFAVYSTQWNEERINDPKLLKRAPFDGALLRALWSHPSTRQLVPGYVSGFYKINDADRFKRDISTNEAQKFHRTYRANAVIDRLRLAYLYPKIVDLATLARYFAALSALASDLHGRGINLIVVRPPLPRRVSDKLAGEREFNNRVESVIAPYGFRLHDFAGVSNDDQYFFDTDHLNREGATYFINEYLAPTLVEERGRTVSDLTARSRASGGT